MAFILEKQKTGSTPYVLIDEGRGYMRLEGESFHENIVGFFKEINEWLDNYLESGFEKFIFDCEMPYLNSSTAKLLLNMLITIDEHISDGQKVVVNWITTCDNEIIIECGEDFQEEMRNLEFNLMIR